MKDQIEEIYDVIIKGFEEMQKQYVDRVVISLKELDTSNLKNITLSSVSYYPPELLTKEENDLINQRKSYTVIALVTPNPDGIMKYGECGIEYYDRLYLLYQYVTKGGRIKGEKMKEFVQRMQENGFKKENLEEAIKRGINEYHKVTKELLKKEGVYKVLKSMHSRRYTPEERIFKKIFDAIKYNQVYKIIARI